MFGKNEVDAVANTNFNGLNRKMERVAKLGIV